MGQTDETKLAGGQLRSPWPRETIWLGLLLRVHSREPAVWLGFTAAALPLAWPALGVPPDRAWLVVPVAIACGALAAIAALGDPPCGPPDGRRSPWLPLWIARMVWPVAGTTWATAGAVLMGSDRGLISGMGGLVIATASATAGCTFVARKVGVQSATAAGVGLALAAAAAAASASLGLASASVPLQTGGAIVAWAVLAGIAWAAVPQDRTEWPALQKPAAERLSPLVGVAMVTSLMAMAGCFFLAPQFAAGYPPIALAWFICLAVPLATESRGGRSGDWLARSAVGKPPLPGSSARALATALLYGALLGWPAVVAMLLPPAVGLRTAGPVVVIASLVASAVVLVAVGWLAGRSGGGQTPRAFVFVLVAVAVVIAAAVA